MSTSFFGYIGELVGLTTSLAALTGGETAGGYAIPFDVNVRKMIEILKRGEETILRPIKRSLEDAFHLLAGLPDDFLPSGRKDSVPQKRKGL